MTDTGKTILVERKFSIYSQFLDTVLQSEGIIQEGETREDALIRVHDELESTADRLRNRINPSGGTPLPKDYVRFDNIGIISKDDERLEIAIDNAASLEELDKLKADNPLFPARLLESFNKKRDELGKSI